MRALAYRGGAVGAILFGGVRRPCSVLGGPVHWPIALGVWQPNRIDLNGHELADWYSVRTGKIRLMPGSYVVEWLAPIPDMAEPNYTGGTYVYAARYLPDGTYAGRPFALVSGPTPSGSRTFTIKETSDVIVCAPSAIKDRIRFYRR